MAHLIDNRVQLSNWFASLVSNGRRTLTVPSFESLDRLQIHQSLETCDVVVDDSEILILDWTADLLQDNRKQDKIAVKMEMSLAILDVLMVVKSPARRWLRTEETEVQHQQNRYHPWQE